jgi:hypothetical protein
MRAGLEPGGGLRIEKHQYVRTDDARYQGSAAEENAPASEMRRRPRFSRLYRGGLIRPPAGQWTTLSRYAASIGIRRTPPSGSASRRNSR